MPNGKDEKNKRPGKQILEMKQGIRYVFQIVRDLIRRLFRICRVRFRRQVIEIRIREIEYRNRDSGEDELTIIEEIEGSRFHFIQSIEVEMNDLVSKKVLDSCS